MATEFAESLLSLSTVDEFRVALTHGRQNVILTRADYRELMPHFIRMVNNFKHPNVGTIVKEFITI